MHIRVVTPVVPTGLTQAEDFEGLLGPEDRLDYTELDVGPASVESQFDAMLAAPDVVAKIIAAEADGVDAIVLDCMEEPGLSAGRECVSIPVLGPCQTAMNMACIIGHRFSMLSVSEAMGLNFENQARIHGAWDKYASTRSVGIPVADLQGRSDDLRSALLGAALDAVTKDRADTVVIGCTGMLGVAANLRNDLLRAGHDVQVIDPIPVTVKAAKLLVECGLSHSKRAFPVPQTSRVDGFDGSILHDFVTGRNST